MGRGRRAADFLSSASPPAPAAPPPPQQPREGEGRAGRRAGGARGAGRGGAVPWRRCGGGWRGGRGQVGSPEGPAGGKLGVEGTGGDRGLRRRRAAVAPRRLRLAARRCRPRKGKRQTSLFWGQFSNVSIAHVLTKTFGRPPTSAEKAHLEGNPEAQLLFTWLLPFREFLLRLGWFSFKRVPK